MNSKALISVFVFCLLYSGIISQAQDVDTAISDLTEQIATKTTAQGKKKVTVLDFTDLQGNTEGELGKYIAEQMTVDFVMVKRDFSVLDRANLKKILAEHKLTSAGLVDPDNAKKLGMFAGVDTMIIGTIIPKGDKISLNAKIITTDTAEIVGAARAEFKSDNPVQKLISEPSPGPVGSLQEEKPELLKTFGDLVVAVNPLKIVDGNTYMLTMTLTNQGKKGLWVGIRTDSYSRVQSHLIDANGTQCGCTYYDVGGVAVASYEKVQYSYGGPDVFNPNTELQPGDSVSAFVKFKPGNNARPVEGSCDLQMSFALGQGFGGNGGNTTIRDLSGKISAHSGQSPSTPTSTEEKERSTTKKKNKSGNQRFQWPPTGER